MKKTFNYFENLNIVSKEPNFTIVLPVKCNAICNFCSWRTSRQHKQEFNNDLFLKKLVNTLENLPKQFNQITISGGEPTLFENLFEVMNILSYHKRKNIKKVVFTTNGEKLLDLCNEKWFYNVVNFVNISRHHYGQKENDSMFGVNTIEWSTIGQISEILGGHGIPININCVLSDQLDLNFRYDLYFVNKFIEISKKYFINSITFRKDYNDGFSLHELEKNLSISSVGVGECPVCRKSKYIINGMNIYFTSSEFEPKDVIGSDSIYELILQPNGNLTSDWESKNVVSFDKIEFGNINSRKKNKSESYSCRHSFSGCN